MKTELRTVGAFVAFSVVGIGLAGSPASAGGPIIVEDMPGDASDEFEYFEEEGSDGVKECVPWEVVFGAQCPDDYQPGELPGGDPADPADPADPTDGGSDDGGGDTGGGGDAGGGYVGEEGTIFWDPNTGLIDPWGEDPTDTDPTDTDPTDTGGVGGDDTGPTDTGGGDTGDTGSSESSASGGGQTSPKPGPSKGKIHLEGPQR